MRWALSASLCQITVSTTGKKWTWVKTTRTIPTTKTPMPVSTDCFTGLGGMTFKSRPEVIISSTVRVQPATTFQLMLM